MFIYARDTNVCVIGFDDDCDNSSRAHHQRVTDTAVDQRVRIVLQYLHIIPTHTHLHLHPANSANTQYIPVISLFS